MRPPSGRMWALVGGRRRRRRLGACGVRSASFRLVTSLAERQLRLTLLALGDFRIDQREFHLAVLMILQHEIRLTETRSHVNRAAQLGESAGARLQVDLRD